MGLFGSKFSVHPDVFAKLAVLEYRVEELEKRLPYHSSSVSGLAGQNQATSQRKDSSSAPTLISGPISSSLNENSFLKRAQRKNDHTPPTEAPEKTTTDDGVNISSQRKSVKLIAAAVAEEESAPTPKTPRSKRNLPTSYLPDDEAKVQPVAGIFSPSVLKKLSKYITHVDPSWFEPSASFKPGLEELLGAQAAEVMSLALGHSDTPILIPSPAEDQTLKRLLIGLTALGLKTKVSAKRKDGVLVSQGSEFALPWWLVPVSCNGRHKGVYRRIFIDCTLSSVAVFAKLMLLPESLEDARNISPTAFANMKCRCVAKLLVSPGEVCSTPVPFGKYFVKCEIITRSHKPSHSTCSYFHSLHFLTDKILLARWA